MAAASIDPVYQGFVERWRMQEISRQILLDVDLYSDEEKIRRRNFGLGIESGDEHHETYLEWQKAYYREFGGIPDLKKWEWKLPRVCHCMHTQRGDRVLDGVPVWLQDGKKIAHYKNLQTCGSVSACPVCAAKITEHRCNEIVKVTEKWLECQEHSILMVTLTIPHNISQSLQYVLEKHTRARRKLREQKPLKKNPDFITWGTIMHHFGLAGTVTAKECTVGFNGWHVHSHELLFFDRRLDDDEIAELRRIITTAWIDACDRVGLDIPSFKDMERVSVDISRAKTPADYITKFGSDDYHKYNEILKGGWGAAEELTKANVKRSIKGKSPFDLLRSIARGENYYKYAYKFFEYCKQFKGKRLIYFSKGFRERLGLGPSMSDEEIVENDNGQSVILGVLTTGEYKIIARSKMRAQFLIAAGVQGWTAAMQILLQAEKRDTKNEETRRRTTGTQRGVDPGPGLVGTG